MTNNSKPAHPDNVDHEDANSLWIRAYSRWFHSAKRDWIIANLQNAVEISPANSKFLAAILSGKVKPTSGKQTSAARARSNSIDVRIANLLRENKSRKAILKILVSENLLPSGAKISAIDKRIDGPKINVSVQRKALDLKLAEIFREISEI